jgi:hypothetical protein
MALPTPGDRAAETSTTTGTGTYNLNGAILGWRTIVTACGTGNEVDYFVRDSLGTSDYEIGRGVITDAATDTLTRATIYASSNGGSAVNWGAGTREIVVTLTANAMNQLLADEDIGVTVQAYNATNTLNAGVTYELLNTNGDVGTTAGTLAIGNHLHTGVYEPADATIVKDADIGVTVQGYTSVLANTTASFLTADESKLDGIEALADVTDTTNVTAAGALMDSEVTNLADVKAFNTTDYATAAQGTTADNALAASAVSTFGGTLIDDADATTARTTLGLGTAATTASTDYATAAQGILADNASPLATTVFKTSSTGSAHLPGGTTAQREGAAIAGYIRFNSDSGSFEGYTGSVWGSIGGGGGGGASAGGAIYENNNSITTNYTLTTNKNGITASPLTIASGVTVTIPTGSRWVVL